MKMGYAIEPDVARKLVRIRLSGFFDTDQVARFAADRAAAITTLRCAPNRHLTLVEVSSCKIQSQQVFAQFCALILDPRWMSRRLAIVVGGSLARMQARRLLTRPGAACFDDIATAEAWLLDDSDALSEESDHRFMEPFRPAALRRG